MRPFRDLSWTLPGPLPLAGIPNMKLDKETVQRRVGPTEAEGYPLVAHQ